MLLNAFIEEVARELELLPAGQTIDADVGAEITSVYNTRWAFLVKKRLAYFPKNNIPDEAVGPLSIWMAGYAAGRLLDAQGKAEKMANVPSAERDLRILAGDKTNTRATQTTYF